MHISYCVIESPQLCPKVRDGSRILAGEAGGACGAASAVCSCEELSARGATSGGQSGISQKQEKLHPRPKGWSWSERPWAALPVGKHSSAFGSGSCATSGK